MGLGMGKDGSIFYVLHFFHVRVGQPLYLTDAWGPWHLRSHQCCPLLCLRDGPSVILACPGLFGVA